MIVLNMIVKNEADIIERCLDSLLKVVNAVVICDTGSTDNTIEIIENWKTKNNIPGTVFQAEWKNFKYNRNLALDYCKDWILENADDENNYICTFDADDILYLEDEIVLDKDQIKINMRLENLSYSRPFLFKSSVRSEWKEVVHEYLYCEGTEKKLENSYILATRDGARNKDPLKYLRDAVLLEEDLENNPDNLRSMFYLAQSYKDFGYYLMAEKLYLERSEKSKDETSYISILEAGKCRLARGKNDDKTLNIFVRAFCLRPHRLEAAYYIVRYYRLKELYAIGYNFGKSLLHTPYPKNDRLFVDTSVYSWKFKDEVALCAFWSNDKKLYRELSEKVLEEQIPDEHRERIQRNLDTF